MRKHIFTFLIILSVYTWSCGSWDTKQNMETKDAEVPTAVTELQEQEIPELDSVRPSISEKDSSTSTLLYRGFYFDIEYPEGFNAGPTEPTYSFENIKYVETDEAFFTSPDGTVEFFVFSPLWAGDPENYLVVGENEVMVSEKTEESGEDIHKKIIYRATVKAIDGSYYRSLVSIKEQVDTGSDIHHVFGIKYKDDASYQKYKSDYIRFKKSLQQYAD